MRWNCSLSSLLFLLLPFCSLSQADSNYFELKNLKTLHSESQDLIFFCRKPITPIPINKPNLDWQKSILITSSKDTFSLQARYDLHEDKVELLWNNSVYILYPEKAEALLIGEKVYIISKYPYNDQLLLSYFELISYGKTSLLLKENNQYYYIKEDNPAQKVNRSKKAICMLFKEQQKNLKHYLKKTKANLKKDEALISLFQFMNKLEA